MWHVTLSSTFLLNVGSILRLSWELICEQLNKLNWVSGFVTSVEEVTQCPSVADVDGLILTKRCQNKNTSLSHNGKFTRLSKCWFLKSSFKENNENDARCVLCVAFMFRPWSSEATSVVAGRFIMTARPSWWTSHTHHIHRGVKLKQWVKMWKLDKVAGQHGYSLKNIFIQIEPWSSSYGTKQVLLQHWLWDKNIRIFIWRGTKNKTCRNLRHNYSFLFFHLFIYLFFRNNCI